MTELTGHPVLTHDECQAQLEALRKERDSAREFADEVLATQSAHIEQGLDLRAKFQRLEADYTVSQTEMHRYRELWLKVVKEHSAALAEVDKLKRIIARELSENDELGSEFVYVQTL